MFTILFILAFIFIPLFIYKGIQDAGCGTIIFVILLIAAAVILLKFHIIII